MAFELQQLSPMYICIPLVLLVLFFIKRHFAGGVCRSTNRLDGKTVIITGANTGIGKETAVDLAKRGARVIMTCRDEKRGQAAAKEVIQRSGSTNVYLRMLDLASLASVRAFAEETLQAESTLDILINNAGVMMCPFSRTKDGFETQFGVNHLGHFLLTNLLLDLLKKSPESRIINVSSKGHRRATKIDFDDINHERNYNRVQVYGHSKLANVLFTRELAKRLEGTNVTTYCLHPGAVRTELARHIPFANLLHFFLFPLTFIIFKTPLQGAQTTIYLAVTEDLEKHNGKYFADCGVAKLLVKAAEDDGMAKKLWDVSADMVGL